MSFITEAIVLEYSPSQMNFHRKGLVEMLTDNMHTLTQGGKPNDFLVIGVFPTEESCNDAYKFICTKMNLNPAMPLSDSYMQDEIWGDIYAHAAGIIYEFFQSDVGADNSEKYMEEFISSIKGQYEIVRVLSTPPLSNMTFDDLINGKKI